MDKFEKRRPAVVIAGSVLALLCLMQGLLHLFDGAVEGFLAGVCVGAVGVAVFLVSPLLKDIEARETDRGKG